MNLDFLEIGTSNFDTLIEKADDSVYGISIEPVKEYLEILPNPKNVIKLNYAISFDGSLGYIDLYHIKESVIIQNRLKKFLKGCNSIGNYHPMHIKHNLQELVTITKVKQISIEYLFKNYNIGTIDYLKIDTEGGDCKILKQLSELIISKDVYRPKKIKFETNTLSVEEEVIKIVQIYKQLGYESYKQKSDTLLILSNTQ